MYYSKFFNLLSSKNLLFCYNNSMKFQERFVEMLKISGKKQTEIAKAVNVSKQCISDYKTGKSIPSIETLYLLCEFLDVSADYLLGLSDNY